jgi:hypothetical protein
MSKKYLFFKIIKHSKLTPNMIKISILQDYDIKILLSYLNLNFENEKLKFGLITFQQKNPLDLRGGEVGLSRT